MWKTQIRSVGGFEAYRHKSHEYAILPTNPMNALSTILCAFR